MHQEPDQEPDPDQDPEPDPEQDWNPEKHEELQFIRDNVRREYSSERCFECPHRTSCGTVWIYQIQSWKHVCLSCVHIFTVLRGNNVFLDSIKLIEQKKKEEKLEFLRTRVRREDSTELCFDCINKTSCGTVWIDKLQNWKHVCPLCLERFISLGDRAFWGNVEVYPL